MISSASQYDFLYQPSVQIGLLVLFALCLLLIPLPSFLLNCAMRCLLRGQYQKADHLAAAAYNLYLPGARRTSGKNRLQGVNSAALILAFSAWEQGNETAFETWTSKILQPQSFPPHAGFLALYWYMAKKPEKGDPYYRFCLQSASVGEPVLCVLRHLYENAGTAEEAADAVCKVRNPFLKKKLSEALGLPPDDALSSPDVMWSALEKESAALPGVKRRKTVFALLALALVCCAVAVGVRIVHIRQNSATPTDAYRAFYGREAQLIAEGQDSALLIRNNDPVQQIYLHKKDGRWVVPWNNSPMYSSMFNANHVACYVTNVRHTNDYYVYVAASDMFGNHTVSDLLGSDFIEVEGKSVHAYFCCIPDLLNKQDSLIIDGTQYPLDPGR